MQHGSGSIWILYYICLLRFEVLIESTKSSWNHCLGPITWLVYFAKKKKKKKRVLRTGHENLKKSLNSSVLFEIISACHSLSLLDSFLIGILNFTSKYSLQRCKCFQHLKEKEKECLLVPSFLRLKVPGCKANSWAIENNFLSKLVKLFLQKKPSKFSINLLVQVTVYIRYLYEWLILLFMVLFWGKCSYFEPHSSKLFTLVTGCCWLSRIREICIWGERRLKTSNMKFKTHVLKESKRILFNQNASR